MRISQAEIRVIMGLNWDQLNWRAGSRKKMLGDAEKEYFRDEIILI